MYFGPLVNLAVSVVAFCVFVFGVGVTVENS
jgi:hypothetical protein